MTADLIRCFLSTRIPDGRSLVQFARIISRFREMVSEFVNTYWQGLSSMEQGQGLDTRATRKKERVLSHPLPLLYSDSS